MASKTKENIIETYLSLLEENEFDKVTVTDLVEGCSISRQTFYYHFDSIEAMLKWSFENEVEKAITESKNCATWMAALRNLVPMFEKYNVVITSARNSTKLLFVQDLIAYNIYQFTLKYYLDVLHYDGEINYFLIRYSSAAIMGLIYMEMKYDDEFSYERLFDEIEKTFKQAK